MCILVIALASLALPGGLDPEATALVERIVEEQGGTALAAGSVASLLESLGYDPPAEVPAGPSGVRRWLPTLVVRLSWAPGHGPSPGRRELVVCLSWPLG